MLATIFKMRSLAKNNAKSKLASCILVQSHSRSVSVNTPPSSLLTSRPISRATLFSAYETDRC